MGFRSWDLFRRWEFVRPVGFRTTIHPAVPFQTPSSLQRLVRRLTHRIFQTILLQPEALQEPQEEEADFFPNNLGSQDVALQNICHTEDA